MWDGHRTSDAPAYAAPREPHRGRAAPVPAAGLRYAAVVGFVAVLILAAHRPTTPARGHAPTLTACHSSITWIAVLPGTLPGLAQAPRTALHGAFWVGLLSLASGVAVVRLACLLRTVRIGSRCGH